MKSTLYKKSFDLFLKRTNEKKVISDFIKTHIPLHKRAKFLDIGGGNGTLARMISKRVGSVVIVEPNKFFLPNPKNNGNPKIINSKWENVRLNDVYDFILAAYVITYFPKDIREQLIEKIYIHLVSGRGIALVISVDAKRGSWRKIHTYFYKLVGHRHSSSDDELKKIIKKYDVKKKMFKTLVIAKNKEEMLKILNFDFGRHPKEYERFSEKLHQFLNKYTDKSGRVILEIVHNAYIIRKS